MEGFAPLPLPGPGSLLKSSIPIRTFADWQKNWSVVRCLIGYDRYNSLAALEALNRVYDLLRLYVNFFPPVMKLVKKTRHGAKVYKIYDTAQTPYQRLLKAGILTEAKRQEVAATYHGLNTVLLLKQINENVE